MQVKPEANLVVRLRGGDTEALETLMEQYAPRVYRLAYGITRNGLDAEEVVQDVFLALFRKLETFQGRAALATWLHRITTNLALNKRRGLRALSEVLIEDYLPKFLADGHRAGHPDLVWEDWSQTPDEKLLSKETREILTRALDGLPDHYRAVLVLRDVERLSTEETAEALGETIVSVKSRLHRARMALREQLTRFLAPRAPRTASRPVGGRLRHAQAS